MAKLSSSAPIVYSIALTLVLGLLSPALLAQTEPAPPATLDPAASAAAAGAAGDPATASSSTAAVSSAASSSVAPPEKPLYESTAERDNILLANARPDETLWLETPNERIIALFKAGETRKNKGALLILHAPELPQLWPAPLEHLRRNLPLYGWETMAVPLPQKYPSKAPARELMSSSAAAASSASTAISASAAADPNAAQESSAAPESSAAASSATSLSLESSAAAQVQSSSASEPPKPQLPREQLIAERVDAAIKELNKVGEFNVVVLVDNSSAFDSLAALLPQVSPDSSKGTLNGPIQAIVLLNLQSQEPLSKEQLASIFAVAELPVLDAFFAPDDQAQKDLRRLHRAEAMRRNVKVYHQAILPPENLLTVNDKQGFWLEKVRGFMETNAQGKELKVDPPSP